MDIRDRNREFPETGHVSCRVLLGGLRKVNKEVDQIMANLREADLMRKFSIQGFDVTGLHAVRHVAEHFAFHARQIIYITDLKYGKDLRFTQLPSRRKPTKK
jgi:Protein of unknown function (DUF1572)